MLSIFSCACLLRRNVSLGLLPVFIVLLVDCFCFFFFKLSCITRFIFWKLRPCWSHHLKVMLKHNRLINKLVICLNMKLISR